MPRLSSPEPLRFPFARGGARRRGSWAAFLVIAFGVLIGFLALTINQGYLWHTRDELRLGGDAASSAATGTLVDDDFLTGDVRAARAVIEDARATAIDYASRHLARSKPLDVSLGRDVAFGVLTTPRGGQLKIVDPTSPGDPSLLLLINTVRITSGQTASRQNSVGLIFGPLVGQDRIDVQAVSTATFDRELRGFRPLSYKDVPLVPIALLSDPTGANTQSWEHQVELRNGGDAWVFDRTTHSFVMDAAGDGLHEFRALLATSAAQLAQANTAILYFGTTAIPDIADQIFTGLDAIDLMAFGGQLLLNSQNEVLVAGTQQGPAEGSADLDELLDALEELEERGEARVWPLYTPIDAGQGTVTVSGFVAARVVRVQPLGPGQPIEILLQPARLATATAVTAFDLKLSGVVPENGYVGKVRVVE